MTQNSTAWVLQLVAFKADPGETGETVPPTVAITSPANNAQVSGIINVTADASDNVGVAGVQFLVDGVNTGLEDTAAPYALAWDTRMVANGAHTLTARARDTAGNTTLSALVTVNVANVNSFQNEILATGFDLPTNLEFLPDGRMLVVELQGKIKVLPPPYTTPDPTLFLQLTNVGSAGVQQGIYDIVLDPNFADNHFYYVFYTAASPNRDRLSRFTANATNTGTVAGSEVVLYQDPQDASSEHHGGAVNFGNDGKLYFTTGEHFDSAAAQLLSSPRGKLHRINSDGTVPTDNPFYDGTGPNVDSIWARGLRNPFRAFYDAPSGRLLIADVGGNNNSTSKEEVNLGAAGANYGWPNSEGPCAAPCTSPIYSYQHNGRDASITGGFVYHGTQFPSTYQGSYFFADYTQNWIRRLTFDSSGNVTGVFNFEPADGALDGPYGDIVYLAEGPDGALYYVDLGYSDIGGTFGVSKIRRIRYVQSNQPPVASASADPTTGPTPLAVSFSSAGSTDPEGQPITYAWTFGDGATSTEANPTHTYTQPGQYTVRLSVSDGVSTSLSPPIAISAGNRPTATLLTPADGATFQAGDVITFSGDGSDTEDGTLPDSAFRWNIDFLHEGHVHPNTPISGTKFGSFTIPTSGHDFSGNTRYRITLTVTDSSGLTDTKSVTIFPRKVNLTFDTAPSGRTLYLDGIAKTTPFVYDTLVGFNHTIEARNQTAGSNTYTFQSWSDGGGQQHTIVVPAAPQTYTATYSVSSTPVPIAFVQVKASTPQTPQSTVATAFNTAQSAGNLNVAVIGWNEAAGNITSVTDSAGNTYQVAVPTFRGSGLSQAVYYAKDIVGAASNTITVQFDKAVTYADVRILEYRGLDQTSPFDVGRSAAGTAATADSGAATTTSANELVLGGGITTACFTAAGTGFTARIITNPDCDIAEDRIVASTGSYSATATASGAWIMQMATFKGAGQ
jgi:glucose/arabinose dehydrogenase/PKD repeat protein